MLFVCPGCKARIPDDSFLCPKCGYPVQRQAKDGWADAGEPESVEWTYGSVLWLIVKILLWLAFAAFMGWIFQLALGLLLASGYRYFPIVIAFCGPMVLSIPIIVVARGFVGPRFGRGVEFFCGAIGMVGSRNLCGLMDCWPDLTKVEAMTVASAIMGVSFCWSAYFLFNATAGNVPKWARILRNILVVALALYAVAIAALIALALYVYD